MKRIIIMMFFFCFSAVLFGQQKDTVKCFLLVSDTSTSSPDHAVWWVQAYDVREKHNTSEGVIDAGICPMCYHDYWKHLFYIDKYDLKPLPSKYCIWINK